MKKELLVIPLAVLLLCPGAIHAAPLGTGFTYQGRLFDAGIPANGSYDVQFLLFDALTGGSQIGATVTVAPTRATNGLFTVQLDYGSSAFLGDARWLQIGVRTNGSVGPYVPLTPRQPLTPSPYALFALESGTLSGALAPGLLSGPYGNAVTLNNAGNSFSGNGAGLTSLNASSLATGTVPDARLSANVALLNANQTFTKTNVFASGGGAGRLIVSNTFAAVDTNLFTGLSLQYDSNLGEGAIMSSFNNGEAFLSFYTKPAGFPVTKQMIIDFFGNVAIDQGNNNNGVLNNATLAGAGLTFGRGSGEGIASKRTAGGNLYGLDFYTGFSNRMSVLNDGFVGIGRQSKVSGNEYFGIYAPVMSNWVGMYIQGSTASRPFYGYSSPSANAWTEVDGTDGDKWKLFNSGYRLTVTSSGSVGIGTTTPTDALLDVEGDTHINDFDIFLRAGSDRNHGLGYRSSVDGGAIGVDGPFLYGFNGGCLGVSGPDSATLTWDYNGNVWISNNLSVATLMTRNASAGIGRSPAANALEVEGNASKTTAGSWLANSDARIKTGVKTVTNALDRLAQVRLVQFRYTDAYRAAHPSVGEREYLNVVAQEFQQVFPESVQRSGEKLPNGDDILQVDTYPLTIYSAAAIQELNAKQAKLAEEIERRDRENEEMRREIRELKDLLKGMTQTRKIASK